MADDLVQPATEHLGEPRSLERIFEPGIERIDVDRQLTFTPEVIKNIFVCGEQMTAGYAQALRQGRQEALRFDLIGPVVHRFIRIQGRVAPKRLTVATPETVQRPARQLLPRIPLPLPEMRESLRRILLPEFAEERSGQGSLVRSKRGRIPFGAVRIIDGNEGRLSAHRKSHVLRDQIGIDLMSELLDLRPLLVRVRLGDPRRFPDALDFHAVRELDLRLVDRTAHRRGCGRFGCAGQRDMSFAGEQARGGIQTDPAGAWQIDLAPCMQISEVRRRP